jgi:hypothetical protein
MHNFDLHSFNSFVQSEYSPLFEASTLANLDLPKKMISAIHQKEEHRSELYPELGYVNMGGRPVTLEYKYFRPSHDIEIPAPIVFTGRKVPPPAGVARTAHYTDFAQYLQDLPNGAMGVLLTIPKDEIFLYLYFKKKWGGGPNEGGQQYAIIVWDKEKKEAVDFGFYGLTTEGVEKQLVRRRHELKGGNTNAKVQEYISSLGDGAPSRNNPLTAYEFNVTPIARTSRETREKGAQVLSFDLVQVFADKYSKIIQALPEEKKAILSRKISENRITATGNVAVPDGVRKIAEELDQDPGQTWSFLVGMMTKFRREIWKEGGGSYQKSSGYDLEEENIAIGKIFGGYSSIRYSYPTGPEEKSKRFPQGDTRISPYDRRARSVDPEKRQRYVPKMGEYASIPSMIKAHTLDGVLHRYMWFLLSDRITAPVRNVLSLLGVDPNSEMLQGLPDFETWLL